MVSDVIIDNECLKTQRSSVDLKHSDNILSRVSGISPEENSVIREVIAGQLGLSESTPSNNVSRWISARFCAILFAQFADLEAC